MCSQQEITEIACGVNGLLRMLKKTRKLNLNDNKAQNKIINYG